ncbi:MAG: hypothetical protein IBX72_06435 [Nitrospirae bacterium]|jgi:hypothetical protein|nr:hypothetical protein [Nitrospirota bacterium]
MEEKTLMLFLKIRESFDEVKEKVSLIKPYFELLFFSTGWALKLEEFEKILGFKPEFVYKGDQLVYAMSVLYRIDDDVTTGIIAHEFAEIVAREKGITDHELIDRICVEKGFGEQLLYALQNDILPGMVERDFIVREDLDDRIENLKNLLKNK